MCQYKTLFFPVLVLSSTFETSEKMWVLFVPSEPPSIRPVWLWRSHSVGLSAVGWSLVSPRFRRLEDLMSDAKCWLWCVLDWTLRVAAFISFVGELFSWRFEVLWWWQRSTDIWFSTRVQRARIPSSSLMVFILCTDDVTFCMQDLTLCSVFQLRSLLRFGARGCRVVIQLFGDLTWTCWLC